MKRFIGIILALFAFVSVYNLSTIETSLRGFLANTSYERGDFLSTKKRYEWLLQGFSGSILLEADMLYNLGNTYYRLGEQVKDAERIRLWKEAIGNYTKSLSKRIDQDTEENLAFVQEKLKKEEQEQQKKEEQAKPQEENTPKDTSDTTKQESPKKNDTNKSGETKSSRDSQGNTPQTATGKTTSGSGQEETGSGKSKTPPKQQWSNGGAYNPIGWSGSDDTTKGLSDADRTDLENYTKELKSFEKQNGKLLNPDKPNGVGSISDQIRNFFGNDSFFQDVLPTNDGKKDW